MTSSPQRVATPLGQPSTSVIDISNFLKKKEQIIQGENYHLTILFALNKNYVRVIA